MVYLLFFVSGLAGLIYEVCWVRAFSNVFGNTVYSASLVTAVFMLGLGVGSRLGGSWADRRKDRPSLLLRTYGFAELGVGALGLLLALLLPKLGGLSESASTYARDANGWYELSAGALLLRYAIGALLITPASVLMGATLTILIRAIVAHDVAHAGWRIGVLYAANTAGAAVGAFATDALFVPTRGIFQTQLVAVGANVLVAAGALVLARRAVARRAASDAPIESVVASSAAPKPKLSPVLAGSIALGLSGFAALGMEIVWFRFLSAAVGAYRVVFSTVLGVILVGIVAGAMASGVCERRFGRERALLVFVIAQSLLAVSALLSMATFTTRETLEPTYSTVVWSTLRIVFLPSFLMGVSFPLVNAHVQDAVASVGRRSGSLYLANTLGSVGGSLAAGLLLAPWVGSQTSFVVFAACAALAPFALVATVPFERPLKEASAAALAVTVVSFAAWLALPSRHLVESFSPPHFPKEKVIALDEGPNEIVAIVDEGAKGRRLVTNGYPMSGTSLTGQRYMRAFAHLPLLLSEQPKRALVVCFGVGSTLHATSLHPSLERIEIADLSRNVLSHATFFADNNHDVLADPRVNVFVADGRQHLRQQDPASYDLVTLEPPPLALAGVSALYSREFYEIVRSRLKPNGYLTQWLPAYQTSPEAALAMVRAFVDVFPSAALLSGHMGELILLGTPHSELVLDLDRLDAALHAKTNERVAADLERVALGTLTQIVGMFLANGDALRRVTAGILPVTDDRPTMEYVFGQDRGPPAVFFQHAEGIATFCPKCAPNGVPDSRVGPVLPYIAQLREMSLLYPRGNPVTIGIYTAVLEATRSRGDGKPPARASFAKAFTLAHGGELDAAAKAYEEGLSVDPNDIDARYNLAAIYASMERMDEAVVHAEKVLAQDPSHVKAKLMLCALKRTNCPER